MNKEKFIQEAWVNFPMVNYDKDNGFAVSFCVNGVTDISEDPCEEIEWEHVDVDLIKWRPKSLQGIEDNNNWIKIESDEYLPKDKTTQYSVCNNKKVFQSTINCGTVKHWYNTHKITHYQPIQKPQPPLF